MHKDKLIPVENKPDLYRDPVSGALINTDSTGADRARIARKRALSQQQEFEEMKEELAELKDLLKQLLERK